MKLASYLSERGISFTEFAAMIGTKPPTVGRYVSGQRVPRGEILKRIARVTGNAVTPADFFDLEEEAA